MQLEESQNSVCSSPGTSMSTRAGTILSSSETSSSRVKESLVDTTIDFEPMMAHSNQLSSIASASAILPGRHSPQFLG